MVVPPQLSPPPGYRPQSADCSVEADLLDFYLLRQRSAGDRLQMSASLTHSARRLSLAAQHQQNPALSTTDFAQHIARCWLQEDYPEGYIPRSAEITWIQDSSSLAAQLHQIFETLEIPYYITGGLAAIAWGEPRTTRDVDVVVSLNSAAIAPLVTALEQTGFYVPGVEEVVSGRLQTL